MKAKRHEPQYWSSCCGQQVEYIGYYRCAACHERALFGGHPAAAADDAARIRAERAALEGVTADDALF